METNTIHTGDAFDVLPTLPADSVHAVVCDPPYGLAFMGRDWDDFEPREYQQWCEDWAREVKRVLKPGGHLLAFSGNRTHHRLFTGVEDAGFEIRDTLTWHYGSGFPKALNVSKAIDKQNGATDEREVVGKGKTGGGRETWSDGPRAGRSEEHYPGEYDKTAPATDAAERWDGFKTGLKPATEFIVMARKPYEGATVDAVLEHGTGALNIDGTRIETDGEKINRNIYDGEDYEGSNYGQVSQKVTKKYTQTGRYPANVVFDETAAEQLDREVGELNTGDMVTRSNSQFMNHHDGREGDAYEDNGGPSRYFYTSKATKSERTLNGKIDNAHPTVKPIDLMEWLVTLATAEEQIVLDPFAGSGTTCKAAKNKNRQFIGIEQQAKWADVARVRSGLPPDDHSHIRSDDEQHGLEQYQ
jgi:site-specific DNA-methyltransferase (adenine-specific)